LYFDAHFDKASKSSNIAKYEEKKTPQLDNWFPIAKTLGTDRAATPRTYVSSHIRKRRTSQVTKYGICLQLGTKHADSI